MSQKGSASVSVGRRAHYDYEKEDWLLMLFEATNAELGDASFDEVFSRFSKDALVDNGYEFDEQAKLIGVLITRSFKNDGPSELAKKLLALCEASRSAGQHQAEIITLGIIVTFYRLYK